MFVWWLPVDRLTHCDGLRLEALLDDHERARAARFHFRHDRLSYVAAHALGRGLLSTVARGEPSDWRFAIGAHGKPEVIGPSRLRLNLSHTHGLAAAALCETYDVGIDVEWLGRRPPGYDVTRYAFVPAEYEQIEAVRPELRTDVFLTFWTLKEAYIKAIGKGLAQPLTSFSFVLDPLSIHFDQEMEDDPACWMFRRYKPTSEHLLALALRHPDSGEMEITMSMMDADSLCRRFRR